MYVVDLDYVVDGVIVKFVGCVVGDVWFDIIFIKEV